MDKPEAVLLVRRAVEGMSRLMAKNVGTLDGLVQQHRDMARIPEVRKEIRAVLPAVRKLREACDRVIAEVESWPSEK